MEQLQRQDVLVLMLLFCGCRGLRLAFFACCCSSSLYYCTTSFFSCEIFGVGSLLVNRAKNSIEHGWFECVNNENFHSSSTITTPFSLPLEFNHTMTDEQNHEHDQAVWHTTLVAKQGLLSSTLKLFLNSYSTTNNNIKYDVDLSSLL